MLVNIEESMLARNICHLRKRYALSRRGLSRLIGMSVFTRKALEEDKGIPLVFEREWNRLSDVFDIDRKTLLSNDLSKFN